MDGLFKVRRKTLSWEKEEIYTVYHVKWFSKKTYELRFLIFRNGKWSEYEETVAWNMFLQGKTNKEIAIELGRSYEVVKRHLYIMKKKKLNKVS